MPNSLLRRGTNLVARTLRGIKRRLFPNFDVGRSRLARSYLKFMGHAARLDYVEGIHGHRMHLDDRDVSGLSVARDFEPAETQLILRTVQRGWTVLDIGANIGYYTLLLARAVGPQGRVFAFEPDPTNFSLLERNVELNGYHNVTLVNSAVWDSTTTLKLYLSEDNRGDHRAYESSEKRVAVEIPALAIDDYLGPTPPRVNFIKMDIQGSECRALRGMMNTLRSSPDALIATEFWPLGLASAGTSASAYLDILKSLGYGFREIGDKADTLTPTDDVQLLAKYETGRDDFANLLCEPRRQP